MQKAASARPSRSNSPTVTKRQSPSPWKVRALQLDLARHMESLPFIKDYTEAAANNGYNMLVLYLEGRVRTKTFPFRPETETYSLAQMAEIVAHAGKLGLEVTPVIATLGHCENFLACPELHHLSEARHGRVRFGKAGGSGSVMCPSLKETGAFFAGYLSELAQVFTGPHFHAGLDEAFDLGFCELCRPRWEREGLGALFIGHLRMIHATLAKLGKRMWIWDDMFELFPERLAEVPRDVVMCHWNYDHVIRPEGSQAHFVNRFRMDWLKEYERLGLDAVVCPWDRYPANVKAITAYARQHKVLGGIETQWEISPRLFPPAQPTLTAFAGLLWTSAGFDNEVAWRDAVAKTLGDISPAHSRAIAAILEPGLHYPAASMNEYRSGLPTAIELNRQSALKLALDVMALVPTSANAAPHLRFIEWGARMELLHWDLRALVPAVLEPRRPAEEAARLKQRVEAADKTLAELKSQWHSLSKPLDLDEMPQDASLPARWFGCGAVIDELRKRLAAVPSRKDWLLILRLHLQEFFSAPYLKVQVICGDSTQTLFEGGHKHDELLASVMGGTYDLQLAFSSSTSPEKVLLTGGGYGGQGVTFLELRNPGTVLKPRALSRVAGPVERPQALLRDDSMVTLLGNPDTLAQMHYPELARHHGIVEVTLAES